jgi:hypothetical protein
MPAVQAFVQHGTLASSALLDEPNVLVTSLTVTPAREEKLYKFGGVTKVARYIDPIISFAFSGIIKALAGLSDQHPGTSITSLANFAANRHGFDPADGVIVYKDPSTEETGDDPTQISFTATQYPFIE